MSARRRFWCVSSGLLLTAVLCAGCDVRMEEILVPTQPDGGAEAEAGPPTKVEKIDLLLMIDNSTSMADKQDILAQAVPDLVQRLVERQDDAVKDLHIGVITSSLGGAGSDTCAPGPSGGYNERMEDMAHLVARSPINPSQPLPTWQDKGFLYWDPTQQGVPPGETSTLALVDRFASIVRGAGQDGCGFEMSLEAWYRFLVDPKPYARIVPTDCSTGLPADGGGCRGPDGSVDETVLLQRKDFLREGSLVVLLMLTDEDDCSVSDHGQSFLALQAYSGMSPFHLPRATSACATDPASEQCNSCGIPGNESDPECQKGPFAEEEDALNLRCWHQKQRFGMDFLFPVDRYVGALTRPKLDDGTWNPLFCSEPSADGTACSVTARDPSRILLAGIVGVPWQLIARDTNDLSKGYLPSADIDWEAVAGDPAKYVDPSSPFMRPSVDPRAGVDPVTGEVPAPTTSTNGDASRINGHEWNISGRNDLQYACVFPLPAPRDCTVSPVFCDCTQPQENPLCQGPDGSYGTKQYRAKAYPAPRILSVMRGLGSRSVVTSICAAEVGNTASPVFGYRPAVDAIVAAMLPSL